VLEIGPGLGVLTTFLADRVRHVHAVEVDTSLEPTLRAALGDRSNVSLVFGDATEVDTSTLRPVATKLVSNLPYNVAATVVIDSLETLPRVQLWCVMVQREVGERFFAEPGTKAYGAVSVLVQLAAVRTGAHAVSRTVFRPRPRVDSMLVAFTRAPRLPHYNRVKQVVQAAFAHRRKTLPNSLALSGLADRDEATATLVALGHEATARAESLAPEEFAELAERL
jgi:16S rRNA (adenine1518-N6/adenine1519-N6)-dimethyltransferase